jgi:hypothetical protein
VGVIESASTYVQQPLPLLLLLLVLLLLRVAAIYMRRRERRRRRRERRRRRRRRRRGREGETILVRVLTSMSACTSKTVGYLPRRRPMQKHFPGPRPAHFWKQKKKKR